MRTIVTLWPAFEHLRPFVTALPDTFESSGTPIYKGRNLLKRFEVESASLIVKRFKMPNLINRIAYVTVRSSKAVRSYRHGLRLSELGILTPQPVAYVEERFWGLAYSYYVAVELKGMTEIRNLHAVCDEKAAETVMEAFGRFTAELHRKGVLHKDYSPGNILFRIEKEQIRFALVDLNRMAFQVVKEEDGYRNFERLWLTDTDFVIAATSYAACMGYDIRKAVEKVLRYKTRFMKRR